MEGTHLPHHGSVISFDEFANNSDELVRLAQERVDEENFYSALVLLRKAHEADPLDCEIQLLIAEVLVDMCCFDEAMYELCHIIDTDNQFFVSGVADLGGCYFRMSRFEAAMDALESIKDRQSELDESELEAVGEITAAYEFISHVSTKVQKKPPIRDIEDVKSEQCIKKCNDFFFKGEYSEMLNYALPKVGTVSPSGDLYGMLCLGFLETDRCVEGLEFIRNIPSEIRKSDRIQCAEAIMQHRIGNEAESDRICRQLFSAAEKKEELNLIVCSLFIELGKFKEAMQIAKKLNDLMPYDKIAMNFYAGLLYVNGNRKAAEAVYHKILKINENNFVAKYFLSHSSEELERQNAIKYLIGYRLPPSGEMKVIDTLNEMIACEDKRGFWDEKSEDVHAVVEWVLMNGTEEMQIDCADFLLRAGSAEAMHLIRFLLINPKTCDRAKKYIAVVATEVYRRETLYVFYDDGLHIAAGWMPIDEVMWPMLMTGSYMKLVSFIESKLESRDSILCTVAKSLAALYGMRCSGDYLSLSNDQIEAAAKLIIERSAVLCEGRVKKIDDIIEGIEVTKKRYDNAAARYAKYMKDDDIKW